MLKMKNYILCSICLAAITGFDLPVTGQQAGDNEYSLKASFILNFAKYVDWPESKDIQRDQKFIIGILGQDPFGPEIETLRNKKIRDTKIEIMHFNRTGEISRCNILFISSSEISNLKIILNDLRGKEILTVGDTEGYAGEGVMINLYRSDNRLSFEINKKAAEDAGLKISSHLLKLGKIVESK